MQNSIIVTSDVAKRLDLKGRKDNTLNVQMVFAKPDGTALDLSVYNTLVFDIIGNGGTVTLTADLSTGLTISGAGSNVLTLVKTAAEMGFAAGNYTYRLTATKTDYEKQWLNGRFYFTDNIEDLTQKTVDTGTKYVLINNEQVNITISNPS